jgi:Flp pilus assembly protein TadG
MLAARRCELDVRATESALATRVAQRLLRSAFRLDEGGASAVEFALVLPLLLVLILGIYTFGMTINHYEMLTGAVSEGARALTLSRGTTTPYASTVSLVQAAAPGLKSANVGVTLTVNGTACNTDDGASACSSLMSAGVPATVTATYPCSLAVMGVNYAPSCNLSQSTTGRIE